MIVTRTSMLSGEVHWMDLPITMDQLVRYERRAGAVQDVFPDLPPAEREFIKSGITPQEWDETFGPLEDDE